jgi:ribosomal protein L32
VQICPICGESRIKKVDSTRGDLILVECERCGRYKIDHLLLSLDSHPWNNVRYLVSAWIRRENKSGIVPIVGGEVSINDLYSADWAEQFRNMGFPQSINEKLDDFFYRMQKL